MKTKSRIMLGVGTLLILMTAIMVIGGIATAGEESGFSSNNHLRIAETAAQSFIMSSASAKQYNLLGASVTVPRKYHGLDGEITAYGFAIEKDGKAIGNIIVGSAAYGFDIFELRFQPPPDIPNSDEVESIVEGTLTSELQKTYVSGPVDLLYLGLDEQLAVYNVGGKKVAVNLQSMDPNFLTSIQADFVSSSEYKARKQANTQPSEYLSGLNRASETSLASESFPVIMNCIPQVLRIPGTPYLIIDR